MGNHRTCSRKPQRHNKTYVSVPFFCAQCGRISTEYVQTNHPVPLSEVDKLIPPNHRCQACRSKCPEPLFYSDPDYNIPDESDVNPDRDLRRFEVIR